MDNNKAGASSLGKVTLKSKDNRTLSIELGVAERCHLLKSMLEDREPTDTEPIPIHFEEKVLQKVFTFVQHELDVEELPQLPRPVPSERLEDCMPRWFAEYIKMPSLEDVYDVIAAANYLDVPSLVELGCAKVGSMMKNKTVPELRQMFNIVNDFTPEEEKTILEGKADIWGEEDDEGDEAE